MTAMEQEQSRNGVLAGMLRPVSASLLPAIEAVPPWQVLTAMLGMGGPVALGFALGQPGLGVLAALGGLAIGSGGAGAWRARVVGMLYVLIAGTAAMLLGGFLAGHGVLSAVAMPLLIGLACLLAGMSRPVGRACVMFGVFLVIATHLEHGNIPFLVPMVLFALGAAWTVALALGLPILFRAAGHPPAVSPTPAQQYPASLLRRRWLHTLRGFAGWQYALRMGLCVAAAQAVELAWGHPRAYWISLTVVLVVQRDLTSALGRAWHRSAGTALGVALAGLLVMFTPAGWALALIIAALAGARPILLRAHYAAYTTVMTPLIILLLDCGRAATWEDITVRLTATLAGCLIGLVLGYLPWPRPARQEARRAPSPAAR